MLSRQAIKSVEHLQLLSPRSSTGLHLVQPLDKLNELGAALVLELILITAEDRLEDGQELRGKLSDGGVFPLVCRIVSKGLNIIKAGLHTQLADHAVQRVVLLVVVLQRQEFDQSGQHILEGNAVTVLEDHAAETASGIVLKAGNIHVQAGFETAEDGGELLDNLGSGGVLNETTNSISSVGAGLRILIAEAVNQQLHESRSVRGHSGTHAVDALGENTDSSGTLKRLGAASVADDSLLEDLPELGKALTESSSHTRDDVETSVNNDPVKLRSLFTGIERIVVGAELKLARVLLSDDISDHRDDIVKGSLIGDERRTAVAEVLSHVTVDVGDGSPM